MRRVRFLGAAAAAVAIAAGTASPALASTGECWSGYGCMWVDGSYSTWNGTGPGQVYSYLAQYSQSAKSACTTGHAAPNAMGTWQDCTSSMYNAGTSGLTYWAYKDSFYGGSYYGIAQGNGWNNLSTYGLNDAISSSRFGSSA